MKEFVVINSDGKEVDWVDPVEDWGIRETRCYWIVQNGYGEYRFWKREGWQYIHREKEQTNDE